MGRIIGDASDVDEVTPLAVADLLRSWGSTERRTVRVRDLVKPE
jgi:hypothetical protein